MFMNLKAITETTEGYEMSINYSEQTLVYLRRYCGIRKALLPCLRELKENS